MQSLLRTRIGSVWLDALEFDDAVEAIFRLVIARRGGAARRWTSPASTGSSTRRPGPGCTSCLVACGSSAPRRSTAASRWTRPTSAERTTTLIKGAASPGTRRRSPLPSSGEAKRAAASESPPCSTRQRSRSVASSGRTSPAARGSRTDGLQAYRLLHKLGFRHERAVLGDNPKNAVKQMPNLHRVFSLLRRWMLSAMAILPPRPARGASRPAQQVAVE